MAEGFHHGQLVGGHHPEGIGGVVGPRMGARGVAVPTQIGHYDAVAASQLGRDAVPHRGGLREAVQQQHRWPTPGVQDVDLGVDRVDPDPLETLEHIANISVSEPSMVKG